MKKKNYFLLFTSILLVMTVCYFAGCGDDGATVFTAPQGDTGATGATGTTGSTGPEAGSASLVVNIWQDEAKTEPFAGPFKVRLERVYSYTPAGASEVITCDYSEGTGTVTIEDLTPGHYDVYVQPLSYTEASKKDIELKADTVEKSVNEPVDIILGKDNEMVFYSACLLGLPLGKGDNTWPGNTFVTISSVTGIATTINKDMGVAISGMDFSNNILYGVGTENFELDKIPANFNYGLYNIDPFTGNKTLINPISGVSDEAKEAVEALNTGYAWITGVAAATDGTLYGFFYCPSPPEKLETSAVKQEETNDRLVKINTATGEIELMEPPSNYPNIYRASIGFLPENKLYFLGEIVIEPKAGKVDTTTTLYNWNGYEGSNPEISLQKYLWSIYNISGMDGYKGKLYFCGQDGSGNKASAYSLFTINPEPATDDESITITDSNGFPIGSLFNAYIADIATP